MKVKARKPEPKTYLVEVTPLSSAPGQSTLSYFSATKLAPGVLVRVPLRSKLTLAVVLSARDVLSAKSLIRKAGFALRKIRQSDILKAGFNSSTLEAVEACAHYYATKTGLLLSALLPKIVSENLESLLPLQKKVSTPEPRRRETILLQMESEERYGQYRALVRQAFAQGNSVMLVVPTHLDAERIQVELSKGIGGFVHVFTLKMKKALALKTWQTALAEKHPVLFITTPSGLFFSRPDLDTVIVERASSRSYRSLTRPHLDLRFFIESLARHGNKQLVLGDSVLPLETLWLEKKGHYGESSLIRWRLPAAPSKLVTIDSKQNENGRFEIFSLELKKLIEQAIETREPIFLFGVRKGLAPTTVCGDCGALLPCLNCGAPVVLHKKGEINVYVCHACSSQRDSATTCGLCGSWKLVPLGIGTEEIAHQVELIYPGKPVFILDKDHAGSDAKARAIVDKFREARGVLVGTELAFFYLDSVAYAGLVSVDSLFSVPDFSIHERIFYLVSRLREMTKVQSIIQTRNIGQQILAWSSQGNITDFYQNEISDRESLLYPPFSIFIKISLHPEIKIPKPEMELKKLAERLAKWQPDIFRHSLVLRINKEKYPDAELIEILSLLPHQFSIKVDPESIL